MSRSGRRPKYSKDNCVNHLPFNSNRKLLKFHRYALKVIRSEISVTLYSVESADDGIS